MFRKNKLFLSSGYCLFSSDTYMICNIRGFQRGGILSYDAVRSGRWVPSSQKHTASVFRVEDVGNKLL